MLSKEILYMQMKLLGIISVLQGSTRQFLNLPGAGGIIEKENTSLHQVGFESMISMIVWPRPTF
jgi:hypothetical protein